MTMRGPFRSELVLLSDTFAIVLQHQKRGEFMRMKLSFLLAVVGVGLVTSHVLAQSTAYQYDIRGTGGLYTHTADDPLSDWTFIGPNADPSAEYDVIAMDADSTGTLYTIDLNTNILGTIDPADASFTTVAPLSGDIPPNSINAFTIDASTDTGYGADGASLWEINLTTGACTLLAAQFSDTTNGGAAVGGIFEIATDSAGNFWVFDPGFPGTPGTDQLWELDITNGDVTPIGAFTLADANFSNNGMDWDPVSGRLMADIYTGGGTGQYGFWDTTTGVFTPILAHASFPAPSTGDFGGPIACFGGTTYQVDFWGDGFQTYDTDPVANLMYQDQPVVPSIFAMDFDETGVLQAFDNNTFLLGTIDLATGGFTSTVPLTGDIAGTPVGITFDPTNGQWYVADPGSLYTLDLTTGVSTFFADFVGVPLGNDPTLVIEISMNSAGEMYAFSSGADDRLYQVDLTTNLGECTEVGVAPVAAGSFIQGMDFDPNTDVLYSAIYISGGTGVYGFWDLGTGGFTTLSTLEGLPPDADGYELKTAIQPASMDPIVVNPDTATITRGDFVGGTATDLAASDNVDFQGRRASNDIQPRVDLEVTSTSSIQNPSAFQFSVEGSVFARGAVEQTVELFDYDASAWVAFGTVNSNRFGDSTQVVDGTGDLARFVDDATGEVRARVRFRALVGRNQFATNTDHIFWTITP